MDAAGAVRRKGGRLKGEGGGRKKGGRGKAEGGRGKLQIGGGARPPVPCQNSAFLGTHSRVFAARG